MISIYNKAIVKELNPRLLEELEELETENNSQIQIVKAYNGEPTIKMDFDGKYRYLHSRFDPSHEAKKLLDSYNDIDDECNLVIYGTGLGYHIKEAIKRFPEAKFYIVEPNIHLLYVFLENVELKDCNIKALEGISSDLRELGKTIPEFSLKYPKKLSQIWLKRHTEIMSEDFERFHQEYLYALKKEIQRTRFYHLFQVRGVTNELHNMKEVLNCQQLFEGDKSAWQEKTAIIVAAGPSLDEEIENLRQIKEKGMAYIFAAGSAVNALLAKGVNADALFSYDPSIRNQVVVNKIKETDNKEIPIVFAGGIGAETLNQYPGKKFYLQGTENYILNYFLKAKEEKPYINQGGTITILALDAAFHMGFKNIIFVGQNLGASGNKIYSSGIDYISSNISGEEELEEERKNVHGEMTKTTTVYLIMKDGIEAIIRSHEGEAKVWNSTRLGLDIEGAEYKPLAELMLEMEEGSVEKEWRENREETEYDIAHLKEKLREIEVLQEDDERQLHRMIEAVEEINKNIEWRKFQQLPKLYRKINLILKRLEENQYSGLFVLPAMIKEYRELVMKIEYLNNITEQKEQAILIYNEFKKFVDKYKNTKLEVKEPYENMIKELKEYCERKERHAITN